MQAMANHGEGTQLSTHLIGSSMDARVARWEKGSGASRESGCRGAHVQIGDDVIRQHQGDVGGHPLVTRSQEALPWFKPQHR